MKTFQANHTEDFVNIAHTWCKEKIQLHKAKSIYLPAGNTPTSLYQFWEKNHPSYLHGVELIQIDEIITDPSTEFFQDYFKKKLPSYESQFKWIQYTKSVAPADLAILGLGLNGHVGFHEPGLSESFNFGCVRLSDETCKTLNIFGNKPIWGITYGLGNLMKAKSILLMTQGLNKAQVLSLFLNKDPKLPATTLYKHSDLTLLVDNALMKAAASLIKGSKF